MEIIQNVHLIPDVIANPYLIIDPDGLTLIDSGIPGSEKKVLQTITNLGYAPADLKRILITHADFDHIGGLAALQKSSGARVFASKIEAAAIALGRSSRKLRPDSLSSALIAFLADWFAKTAPVQVDEFLADGQQLPILGGLQVVDTQGHTPGHLSYFSRPAGIIFVGDSMVSDEAGLHGSVKVNTWDEALANEAVRKQAALGAAIVCPGHGPVIRDALGRYPQE